MFMFTVKLLCMGDAGITDVCWTVWLEEQRQLVDTGGCNVAGLVGLTLIRTLFPHKAWEGAEGADQQSSKEEEVCPKRKRQKVNHLFTFFVEIKQIIDISQIHKW